MGVVTHSPGPLRRALRWAAMGAFFGGTVAGLGGFVVALATFPAGDWFQATIIVAAAAFVIGAVLGVLLAFVRPRTRTDP